MHGGQLLGDSFRNTPADYFGPGSGYGRVFTSLREMKPKQPLKVGVIGLGAGRDRGVDEAGRRAGVLRDQPARGRHRAGASSPSCRTRRRKPSVVLGDGRLSLEREPPRQLRRAGHRRLLRRLDPDAPGHARGDGDLPQAPQARRRDRVPGHQPLHRPAAGGEAPGRRVRPARRSTSPTCPEARDGAGVLVFARPTRSSSRATRSCSPGRASPRRPSAIADQPGLPVFTDAHHNLLRILK